MRKCLFFLPICLLLLQGCVSVNRPANPVANYSVIAVFYATDRNPTGSRVPAEMFGADRGDLSYGECFVSVPRDHRMGKLESPSIYKLEFSPDPNKQVVLMGVHPQEQTNFYRSLFYAVHNSKSRSALIFIHGYNVTFEDAARRTAQLSYDLGFDGTPAFYSWPSQGTLIGYPMDETNNAWTELHLQKFLKDFAIHSQATNIFVIAHSMGCRALSHAFASLALENPTLAKKFKAVVLTAPDIDADVFKTQIAPQIISTNAPLFTLYASSVDKALLASKMIHGYRMLGDANPSPEVIPAMDTVDVTAVDTSFIGHSYYGDETSVISDLFYLIRDDKSLREYQRARLAKVGDPPDEYWRFQPN